MDGTRRRRIAPRTLFVVILIAYATACVPSRNDDDPHYTAAGYFDVFVCHWPDRPPFLIGLFGTTRYDDVAKVEVIRPDGEPLGVIPLTKHETLKDASGEERRTYKSPLPSRALSNGWYRATITLKNGQQFHARDYVEILTMPIVTGLEPQGDDKQLKDAQTLRWRPIAGDVLYRVNIYDMWQDKTEIYASDLVRESSVRLPPGVLKPGGSYVWRVHARQATADAKWGDFNHGSKSAGAMLSLAP